MFNKNQDSMMYYDGYPNSKSYYPLNHKTSVSLPYQPHTRWTTNNQTNIAKNLVYNNRQALSPPIPIHHRRPNFHNQKSIGYPCRYGAVMQQYQPYQQSSYLKMPINANYLKQSYSQSILPISVYCVICKQNYNEETKQKHLMKHRNNNDIPLPKTTQKYRQYYIDQKHVRQRPIIQPQQYNIQYKPNELTLHNIINYVTSNNSIGINTDDQSKYNQLGYRTEHMSKNDKDIKQKPMFINQIQESQKREQLHQNQQSKYAPQSVFIDPQEHSYHDSKNYMDPQMKRRIANSSQSQRESKDTIYKQILVEPQRLNNVNSAQYEETNFRKAKSINPMGLEPIQEQRQSYQNVVQQGNEFKTQRHLKENNLLGSQNSLSKQRNSQNPQQKMQQEAILPHIGFQSKKSQPYNISLNDPNQRRLPNDFYYL